MKKYIGVILNPTTNETYSVRIEAATDEEAQTKARQKMMSPYHSIDRVYALDPSRGIKFGRGKRR